MIAYVNGILEYMEEGNAVVDVGGVGLNVGISGSTMDRMPKTGETVKLYTYTSVREDDISLFGFLSRDELSLFKMLITVSGVGPKAGLAILSVLTPDNLQFAIISGDSKAISKAPGIGKKTAERITLELRDKIKMSEDDITEENALTPDTADGPSSARDEAVAALVALGYNGADAMKAVRKVLKMPEGAGCDTEALLKLTLKELL